MKRITKIAAFALIIMLGSSLQNKTSAQYTDNDQSVNQYAENNNNPNDVSYQTFYDQLSPYGQWVDYPGYGYVWVPNAGPDFRPYSTNGHWVWTEDYEWMWVSDYEWGWAPFHYGRWMEDDSYGWMWVPGYEWSPAWVAWRDGGDYYGWAPLRPGINININFNIGSYNPPYDYWIFAPRRYITSPRIYDYCVDRRQNLTIINYTTIINTNHYGSGYGFRTGPSRFEAERYCGTINPVHFRNSYTPGRSSFRNNEVSIYRPNVRRDDSHQFSPRQFQHYGGRNGNSNNGNTNNGFRNDNGRRNGNDNNQGDVRNNNGRNRDDNSGFRNNQDVVRNNDNDNNNFRRRFDNNTNNNNNGQSMNNGNTRTDRPTEWPGRNTSPVNNDNNRFDRRNNQSNNNQITRQPDVRNDNSNNNNWHQRQPVQQMERRQEPVQQRQPIQQMERRQEPVRQQEQQQPRQFERRSNDNGNHQQQTSNDNKGSSRDSRRRF